MLKSSYAKTAITFLVIVIGVVAFWFGVRAVLGTEYPLLAVASGSMEPTLNTGDIIIVRGGINPCDIKAGWPPDGTIIVFRKPGEPETLIVHRTVRKESENGAWVFRTKGDRSWYITGSKDMTPDPWTVTEKDIVGVVVGQIPWLGHIPLFVRTQNGIRIVTFLFVILIFAEVIHLSRKMRKVEPSLYK